MVKEANETKRNEVRSSVLQHKKSCLALFLDWTSYLVCKTLREDKKKIFAYS